MELVFADRKYLYRIFADKKSVTHIQTRRDPNRLCLFKSYQNAALFGVKAAQPPELVDLNCRVLKFCSDQIPKPQSRGLILTVSNTDLPVAKALGFQFSDQRFK